MVFATGGEWRVVVVVVEGEDGWEFVWEEREAVLLEEEVVGDVVVSGCVERSWAWASASYLVVWSVRCCVRIVLAMRSSRKGEVRSWFWEELEIG